MLDAGLHLRLDPKLESIDCSSRHGLQSSCPYHYTYTDVDCQTAASYAAASSSPCGVFSQTKGRRISWSSARQAAIECSTQ